MYLFAASMLVVALAAWWYIPNVQKQDFPVPDTTIFGTRHVMENKTLEHLGEGREHEPDEEKMGMRNRTIAFKNRIMGRFRRQEDD